MCLLHAQPGSEGLVPGWAFCLAFHNRIWSSRSALYKHQAFFPGCHLVNPFEILAFGLLRLTASHPPTVDAFVCCSVFCFLESSIYSLSLPPLSSGTGFGKSLTENPCSAGELVRGIQGGRHDRVDRQTNNGCTIGKIVDKNSQVQRCSSRGKKNEPHLGE